MNKKCKNLILLALSSIVCFYLWMGLLGNLYADGFLNLTAIENETETMPLINFLVVCLCPPLAFGTMLFDYITDYYNKKRSYNGNKNEN